VTGGPSVIVLAATVVDARFVPQAETIESGDTISPELAVEALVTVDVCAWAAIAKIRKPRHTSNLRCNKRMNYLQECCGVLPRQSLLGSIQGTKRAGKWI
jgi:hypothetical protein